MASPSSSPDRSIQWLAGAIVVAGGLVGIGLWAGLRDRSMPVAPGTSLPSTGLPTNPSGSDVEASTSADSDGTHRSDTGRVASPSVPKGKSEVAAKEALASLKKRELGPKCWVPRVAAQPEPAESQYSIALSFDAAGIEVGRGISELRGRPSRADVARCLREQPLSLRIPPPGQPLSMTLPLAFP